jgi:hypothetical protein
MKKLTVYIFGYGIFLPIYLIFSGIHILTGFMMDALSDFDREFLAKYK